MDIWYNQGRNYDYNNEKYSLDIGNFAQIIWKSSLEVGIGYTIDSVDETVYLVALYYPGGNIEGKYNENLSPPPPNLEQERIQTQVSQSQNNDKQNELSEIESENQSQQDTESNLNNIEDIESQPEVDNRENQESEPFEEPSEKDPMPNFMKNLSKDAMTNLLHEIMARYLAKSKANEVI
jgi:hypothetical protein